MPQIWKSTWRGFASQISTKISFVWIIINSSNNRLVKYYFDMYCTCSLIMAYFILSKSFWLNLKCWCNFDIYMYHLWPVSWLLHFQLTARILSPGARRPSFPATPSARTTVTKIPGSAPMCGWSVPPRMLKPKPELNKVTFHDTKPLIPKTSILPTCAKQSVWRVLGELGV